MDAIQKLVDSCKYTQAKEVIKKGNGDSIFLVYVGRNDHYYYYFF